MTAEKTKGQVSHAARLAHARARLGLDAAGDETYENLSPEQQGDEEAGAQAVLDNRTPWGDVDAVGIEMYRWHAVVRSGGGEVVKVIDGSYNGGLRYYDSLEEWKRANAAGATQDDPYAGERPDPHPDLDAGEFGGAMTDADYYDRIAAGARAEQEREALQHARDMAAEDGDLDNCEPTL